MQQPDPIRIAQRTLALDQPSYFIADIAANHDGDLARAKDLIWLAKSAGADCAKFQHFKAEKIVSQRGFEALGSPQSHQASWKKPVFDVYRQYELNREWNVELVATARAAQIDFMTTPYDDEAVDSVNALGLDVRRAEALLGRPLPDAPQVTDALAALFRTAPAVTAVAAVGVVTPATPATSVTNETPHAAA